MTASGSAAGYRIHHRFAEALPHVPPDVVGRVWKLVEQLRRDPQAVRTLKGCKKVKGATLPLFEARVQDDWRIIWMSQPNGEPYLLMIGDHDHIFSDAVRRIRPGDLDDRATIDDAQLPSTGVPESTGQAVERPMRWSAYRHAPALNLPFERIPDAMFAFWGVPVPLAPVIRCLEDENALAGLIGELPDDTICAILEYAKDGTIRRARGSEESTAAEVLLSMAPERPEPSEERGGLSPLGLTRELLVEMEVPEVDIPRILAARSTEEIGQIALPIAAAHRLLEAITLPRLTGVAADVAIDLYAESQADLQDFYTGDIKRLLFYLQPAQREVVDLPSPALHLVKGVAGSGKSTVALYRAKRLLASDATARVLFLTYSKTLARTASELAHELLPAESVNRLTVVNVHRWMTEYLRSRRGIMRFASPEQRRRAMAAALEKLRASGNQSRILERSTDWFLDEISHSIKGRSVVSLDGYLSIERTGRASALADAGRRLVWQVYEAYQDAMGDLFEWDDLPRLCLEELTRGDQVSEALHVIVDEGQDLPPVVLRLCIALAAPENPSVLILADAAQSIYRRGFRWKDIGVSLRGHQVHHLKNNYRNTLEILRLSNGFLERNPGLREDGEQGALDENTPRRGPLPTLVVCTGAKGEAQVIARRIKWLRKHKGVPFANVAVLAPWKKRLEYLACVLREEGIPVSLYTDEEFSLGANCVKLATLHSAKGLEFPIVFVADVNDGVLPRRIDSEDEEARTVEAETARRLLYVGMTRAMQELYITTTGTKRSPLLEELPSSALQQVIGR